jgi:hypothetical protein
MQVNIRKNMGIKAARVGDAPEKHFNKKGEGKSRSRNQVLFVPTAGVTVRFLTPSTDWVWYQEYWDNALKQYVVATEENESEYEDRDDPIWPSNRYLAAAVNISDNRVVAVKLPKTLADDIKAMEEKYEEKKGWSLSDYDLELSKEGTGQDTSYRVLFEEASNLDISRYEIPDLFKILEAMIDPDAVEGGSEIEDDNAEDTPKTPAPKKKFSVRK